MKDWTALWQLVEDQFPCGAHSLHGPGHWRRVERFGIQIARRNGAVLEVVRLFALFHDSRRENEDRDDGHGLRGAELAAKLRGAEFHLSDSHFELLRYACEHHTAGRLNEDSTIGACWDADRLDLGRVGVCPSPRHMSTEQGRQMAEELRFRFDGAPDLAFVANGLNLSP